MRRPVPGRKWPWFWSARRVLMKATLEAACGWSGVRNFKYAQEMDHEERSEEPRIGAKRVKRPKSKECRLVSSVLGGGKIIEWGALDSQGVYGPAIGRLREISGRNWGQSGDCGRTRGGPSPFRFENMWLKEEGFKDLLRNWWVGFNSEGAELKSKIQKEALEEYEKWVIMEETAWRQKSRELWLREGDKTLDTFIKWPMLTEGFPLSVVETDEWRPRCNGLQVGVLEGEAHLEFLKEEVMGFFKEFHDQGKVENVEEVALEFGCKVSRLPSSYLGLPWGLVSRRWLLGTELRKDAKKREFEIGAYPKGFSLGWWGIGKEASFSGMWSWRFAVEREALWRQVISAKYGEEEGGWRSCVVRGSLGLGCGKRLGEGGKHSHSGGGVWAPRFSRSINDWEVIEVERLLLRLQGRRVYSDVEDEVIWTKAKDKRFSVKSLYKLGPGKT
ncbi:hypothetical protein CK203_114199 [Vitis vinifera]|uniref:DUF4283 domain-containing protein n=1 Tax=Vitis vinifera TaxID=29760 RepID=A0A438CPE2_VITVI|nr:hypothetical protein CK203_114199 [Vitis vinifera]